MAWLPILIIATACVIGIAANLVTKHPDGPIEERAEEVIESELEGALGMPDGTFDGMIDLSPESKEV